MGSYLLLKGFLEGNAVNKQTGVFHGIPALNNNGESSQDKVVLLNTYFYECFNKLVLPLEDDQLLLLNPTNFPVELVCTE